MWLPTMMRSTIVSIWAKSRPRRRVLVLGSALTRRVVMSQTHHSTVKIYERLEGDLPCRVVRYAVGEHDDGGHHDEVVKQLQPSDRGRCEPWSARTVPGYPVVEVLHGRCSLRGHSAPSSAGFEGFGVRLPLPRWQ